ncbi:MAG: hypothetical protein H0V44_15085, partial [Planctomycetes bacterium]|nr:hypothetical protein [Planctomycetota bacterium]
MPGFAASPRWLDAARRDLARCADAQLTIDGGQIEGCPHYHNGSVAWFAQAVAIARDAGAPMPESYQRRVRDSVAYSLHSIRPDGTSVPWGDSDADHHGLVAAFWACAAFGDPTAAAIAARLTGPEAARAELAKFLWIEPGVAELEAVVTRPPPVPQNMPQTHLQRGLD